MTTVRMTAAELADLLDRENAALRRLDLPTALALFDAKRAAVAAFELAVREARGTTGTDEAMHALATRLRDATTENKRLLERAMAAQQHVMSLLAQAAARQAAPSGRYGARGAYVGGVTAGAFALSARA